MVSWSGLIPLVLTALAVMGSPGPATISIAAVGGTFGARRSLPYLAGLVLGTTCVLLAVAVGLSAALLALPGIGPALTIASLAYIVYLAWKIASAPPLRLDDPAALPPSLWGGLVLGIANPKAYVAIAAVYAASHLAADPGTDTLAKTAVLTIMVVAIHVAWLFAGTTLGHVMRNPTASRIANIGLAGAMLAASLPAMLHIAG